MYLVTSGKYNSILVSTEILVSGASALKEVEEIPLRALYVAGVSIDNRIIMMGNIDLDKDKTDDIIEGGSVDQYSKSGYTTNHKQRRQRPQTYQPHK